MISPRTGKLIAAKYAALPNVVSKIEPSEVGSMFKHSSDPVAFFPLVGLFSTEFALGYCHNLNSKRCETDVSHVAPPVRKASTKWTR
jgi:hypothetical protein